MYTVFTPEGKAVDKDLSYNSAKANVNVRNKRDYPGHFAICQKTGKKIS